MKTRIEQARDRLSELVEDPSRPDIHAAAVELLGALNAADNPAPVSPPAEEPRTIRQWLETLPDGYRERAIANMSEAVADVAVPNTAVALESAFEWSRSPERARFWSAVYNHYFRQTPLPPLP